MIYLMKKQTTNLVAFYTFNAAIAHAEKVYNVTAWEKTNNQLSRCVWRGESMEGVVLEIEQIPMLDVRRL